MVPLSNSGDILLISPPFAGIERPALGLHILHKIAQRNGLDCDIYYANMHLANAIGEATYVAVAYSPPLNLIGERLFSTYAFPDVTFSDEIYRQSADVLRSSQERQIVPNITGCLKDIELSIGEWLNSFRTYIRTLDFKVFGLTSMFAQNLSCVTLARIIREEKPDSQIVIGGANCDGGMAEGIATLSDDFDQIFVGESERRFDEFCKVLMRGETQDIRFVNGAPMMCLDETECPDFEPFFRQLDAFIPNSELAKHGQIFLSYETSRGCWWGQKHHCTFCGLNANGMSFRAKTSEKVLSELRSIRRKYGKLRIAMTDNIMPLRYFDDLLPEIAREGMDLDIFYEQKSNLKVEQLRLLKAAGVNAIQPGIEAVSTTLLKRMKKGVSAAQNIRLLRECRHFGIEVIWNLLFGFPGEGVEEYRETLALLPYLRHLSPPNGFSRVSFDRFSPYYDDAHFYGIENLRPHPNYKSIYPESAPVEKLAYHFIGDADVISEGNPELARGIRMEVQTWIKAWRQPHRPVLCVTRLDKGNHVVTDTRDPQNPILEVVSEEMAVIITTECRQRTQTAAEALYKRWAVEVDNIILGIAIRGPETVNSVFDLERDKAALQVHGKLDGPHHCPPSS